MTHEDKRIVIAALEELKGDCVGLIAATIEDCQKVVADLPEDKISYKTAYGYPLEGLAQTAALMEQSGVSPADIKRLSENIIALYGVILRGIRKEIETTAETVAVRIRYPGCNEMLRMLEEK